MVACWAHVPKVASSNLASNTIIIIDKTIFKAIVTQLVRVLGCDSKSHGFKSRQSPLSCIKSNALNECLNIKQNWSFKTKFYSE